MPRSKESYLRGREATKQRSRERVEQVADIGELPAVVDPERKESCRLDLLKFLVAYFPASTGLKPFSDAHRDGVARIQRCVLEGGLFVNVFPRGFAKTTISENSAIWAVLYGHRKFVPIFGSDATSAQGNIDSIKTELAENDLLYEDFPEICHAIRALEGKPQRCASQSYDGEQTHIEWRADTIVLPTLPGSPASGTILTAGGLMGASRGMKHKRPDGTQQRPDFVLLDDPQTDESARTPLQVAKRLGVVRKSILKLGGHNRKIAAVMNATVIQPEDMVEQVMDPKKFPAFQSMRVKMVRKFGAAHETLWLADYARLRNTFDQETLGDQQRAHRAATEFYKANRAKMDDGCEVTWEHCFDPETELSAVQHAYNILIDDGEEVFASECQNEPLVPKIEGEEDGITADQVIARTNGLERRIVPLEANRVVAFIDVHDEILYYTVAAFGEGFSGAVIDYGTWPDQKRAYFSHREVKRKISKATGIQDLKGRLYKALDILAGELAKTLWKREDGAALSIEKGLIDCRDGNHQDTVKQFCRRNSRLPFMPSEGIPVGAKRQAFNSRPPLPGERRGWNWRQAPEAGSRGVIRFDVNAWKSRMLGLLKAPAGSIGHIGIFGKDSQQHRMFGDHVASEYGVRVTAGGRTVVEYMLKPGQDNHYLDDFVGCGVAAGTLGVDTAGEQKTVRKRVKLSEMQKKAKHWKAA